LTIDNIQCVPKINLKLPSVLKLEELSNEFASNIESEAEQCQLLVFSHTDVPMHPASDYNNAVVR
jgi:hypothetical protein